MDHYLQVDDRYCCGYNLSTDDQTWTNVTPTHLTLALTAGTPAFLTCLRHVLPYSEDTDEVENVVVNVTTFSLHNVTVTWQSQEALLRTYLGEKYISLTAVVVLTLLYTLIFLSGVLGNVCTCVVIVRNRCMHTATNYYLFSLAVSDVLTLLLGK